MTCWRNWHFTTTASFHLPKWMPHENMRIAGRHQVKGFPTAIAYSHGQITDRFHGAQTERFVREFLDRLITQHTARTCFFQSGCGLLPRDGRRGCDDSIYRNAGSWQKVVRRVIPLRQSLALIDQNIRRVCRMGAMQKYTALSTRNECSCGVAGCCWFRKSPSVGFISSSSLEMPR